MFQKNASYLTCKDSVQKVLFTVNNYMEKYKNTNICSLHILKVSDSEFLDPVHFNYDLKTVNITLLDESVKQIYY